MRNSWSGDNIFIGAGARAYGSALCGGGGMRTDAIAPRVLGFTQTSR